MTARMPGAPEAAEAPEAIDLELPALLDAIYHVYHHDFRRYAARSIGRRIQTALIHFRCRTIAALRDRVLRDPAEFGVLLRYLTVQVSDMFRDPDYFRAIREQVIPHLQSYAALKIWVAGCATGEEAYSLAIMLREEGLLARTLIYATDIHPESLRIAQAGVYDLARFAGFSGSYLQSGGRGSLSDHYAAAYRGAVLDRGLRQAIVFADHSLATDSAFAEVQLVSCRNVLIYFDRQLQDRAIGVMRDALCRKGFLGLGTNETLRFSAQAAAFCDFVPAVRIYQRS
ncbi:MAG TPA: CheR family methyltransferase [Kofleriaceae bacterium]